MTRRLWMHVGTPKTGTTFLQAVAWRHRTELRRAGLLLPGRGVGDHFRASADLRGEPFRLRDPALAEGAWQGLLDRAATWDGDVLLSHELFGPATTERAAAATSALAELGEVHVVLTARDLARQVPAEWQEHLKHRSVLDFGAFVHRARTDRRDGPFSPNGYHFWHVQDLPAFVDRWGGADGAGVHVHVVTVPPADAGRDVLWARFAGLLGVGHVPVDLTVRRENTSLAAEQAELVRRLNAGLGDRLPLPGTYPDVVKGFLAHQVLARREGTGFGLVGDDHAWAVEVAQQMVAGLRDRAVDVVGDLADLVPGAEPAPTSGTARVGEQAVLAEALAALTATLERLAVEKERVVRLRGERDQARAELDGDPHPQHTAGGGPVSADQGSPGLASRVARRARGALRG